MIIIVSGLPGTGKSTFASALAERLKVEYINTDIVRKTELTANYADKNKEAVYLFILSKIRKGTTMVLDGSFSSEKIRNLFKNKANEMQHTILLIELTTEDRIVKERISKKREWSDAGYEVYLKVKQQYEPIKEEHLILDSGKLTKEEMLESALTYISDHDI